HSHDLSVRERLSFRDLHMTFVVAQRPAVDGQRTRLDGVLGPTHFLLGRTGDGGRERGDSNVSVGEAARPVGTALPLAVKHGTAFILVELAPKPLSAAEMSSRSERGEVGVVPDEPGTLGLCGLRDGDRVVEDATDDVGALTDKGLRCLTRKDRVEPVVDEG